MVRYNILDNGGISFIVDIDQSKKECIVYRIEKNDILKQIMHIKFIKIWPGIGKHVKDRGNSIVMQIKQQEYVYIGGNLISRVMFSDPIIKLRSPIGNSGVPYPYIVTRDYYFLLLENVKIPKHQVAKNDPYTTYYEMDHKQQQTFVKSKMKILKRTR